MSATTQLKFTLGSGDPIVIPDNTTTTTTVGIPNTGENSSAGDQMSGTVFSTLFAVIGIVALIVLFVKYLKKNRKISFAKRGSFHISAKSRILVTSAFVLAIAFLGSTIISQAIKRDEKSAEAASTELPITYTPEMTFDVDRGEFAALSDTIKIDNNGAEYILYIYTASDKFCLNGTSTCLSSVAGNIASSSIDDLSSVAVNQWGVSLKSDDPAAKIWGAAPVGDAGTVIYSGTNSDVSVNYAVNVGEDLPDGTYYGSVSYRAVSKDDPSKVYNVIVNNGYVNKEGSESKSTFPSGIQVWIRQNCGTKKFIGWYVNSGLSSVSNIKGTENPYYFIMPSNDVEVTAVCEGDPTPTEADIKIVYDKNASDATGTTPDTELSYDDKTVTLQNNGFTRTGYTFLGWSCNKDATKGTYKSGQTGVSVTELKNNCPHDEESSPEVITVYAIWLKEPEWLQEVTQAYCDNMNVLDTKTLKDGRDNKEYSFRKYADGRCWLLQDLNYTDVAANGNKLYPAGDSHHPATTDVSSTKNFTLSTSDSDALYKTQSGYSTLYNYKAATAGMWNNQGANTNISDSLCPANWKLPFSTRESGSFSKSAGEFYQLWEYNIGKKNSGGDGKDVAWKNSFLLATNDNSTYHGPHFTYNGSWSFGGNDWADENAKPDNYASYFFGTIATGGQPAAYNPHKSASGSVNDNIDDTNPDHGSSVRCLLRTDKQMTDRSYSGPDNPLKNDYSEYSGPVSDGYRDYVNSL
ncbi:InlB B-repeat-containing protein [Candidatus Saccharibacteria bacterium]|nr:InlB B-repeat-containing protein [Candidatus Saccharibacteria bacterium]MBQ3467968.1 InlB B-repeat-containing protein [Candidatus Saccharibacteria bacterium]